MANKLNAFLTTCLCLLFFAFAAPANAETVLAALVSAEIEQSAAAAQLAEADAELSAAKAAHQPVAEALAEMETSLHQVTEAGGGTVSDESAAAESTLLATMAKAIAVEEAALEPLTETLAAATEAQATAKAAFDAADAALTKATSAWQSAMLAPITAHVAALAERLGTAERALVEATARAESAEGVNETLSAEVVDFCGKNAGVSLCSKPATAFAIANAAAQGS